jgi:hypothetical protein
MTNSESRRLSSAHFNAEERGLLGNENSRSGGADQGSELEMARRFLRSRPNTKARSKNRRDGYDGLQTSEERAAAVDNLNMARSSDGDEWDDEVPESNNGSIDNDIIDIPSLSPLERFKLTATPPVPPVTPRAALQVKLTVGTYYSSSLSYLNLVSSDNVVH